MCLPAPMWATFFWAGAPQSKKTTGSGFSGFLQDPYTTLADCADRILATVLKADWTHCEAKVHWNQSHALVRQALLEQGLLVHRACIGIG